MKIKCDCCGYYTVEDIYDICPVCFWEKDDVPPDFAGGANSVSLFEARENFKKIGACEERFVNKVRPPLETEKSEEE